MSLSSVLKSPLVLSGGFADALTSEAFVIFVYGVITAGAGFASEIGINVLKPLLFDLVETILDRR